MNYSFTSGNENRATINNLKEKKQIFDLLVRNQLAGHSSRNTAVHT